MRSVMRAAILIALPGAIFAPLISAVHALSFCRNWSDDGLDGLLPLLTNELPPCPSQPSAALIVLTAVATGAITIAWNLAPLYTSRTTE
jgi:hypothetical protein